MRFLCLLMVMLCAGGRASAEAVGEAGAVYEIAEKDALSEIEELASRVDWRKVLDGKEAEKRARQWRPPTQVSLPRSREPGRRTVDVSYTLDEDVALPDGTGVYPKGFVINPLDLIPFQTTVVIDASDTEQLEWFRFSSYARESFVTLLISGGDFGKAERELHRPVYYLDRMVADKFSLRAVPSVITQQGRVLQVEEVDPALLRKKRGAGDG